MNNFIFKKYVYFIERSGYFPMIFQPYNCSEVTDISPTLTANCGCGTSSAAVLIASLGDEEMNKEERNKIMIDEVKRIVSATRKCDVGVTVHDNGDIRPHRLDKKKSGISEMQIYKQAGNSIVVDVLEAIFTNLKPYLSEGK